MAKGKKTLKKEKPKDRPKFDVHGDAIKALWGIGLIVLFFVSILSFFGKAGAGGRIFSETAENLLGVGRFVIPIALVAASYILFTSYKRNSYIPLIAGLFLFISGILGILHIVSPQGVRLGGQWGYLAALPALSIFGKTAGLIIFLGLVVAAIIVVFNIRIGKIIADRRAQIARLKESVDSKGLAPGDRPEFKVKTWQEGVGTDAGGRSSAEGRSPVSPPLHPIEPLQSQVESKELKGTQGDSRGLKGEDRDFATHDARQVFGDFRLPPLELLEKETGKPSSGDIIANANIIKRTLQNFGIEVEMGEVNVGPTVTQFTLKPAEGVKLARIMALNNDLSLAVAAHPIRIEAPIPGRSLVGIEIPNKGISIVRLKNLLESPEFQGNKGGLALILGRDVTGAPVRASLAKMPHLLIAGSTGSGKTICLNVIILSLLYQSPPNLLKFILIDPKRVEFPVYSDIPHLLAPVVVDVQKTVNALKWAVSEMERRFEVLSQAKTRDIASFNSNKKAVADRGALPYIVIVIDELADLMAARGKEIEALIVRLAQMARAVGIHLVLATQRPSVEVITGLIKANITSRIAFQVASQVDSRTVLDMSGAEKLLGNGDMLYLSGDASKPRRVQGAYVAEKEVRRIADYLREEGMRLKTIEAEQIEVKPQSILEPILAKSSSVDFDELGDSVTDDELYDEAKTIVIQAQKASSSLLQRRLKVGYARSARLIDMLEENGVVGPGDGAKPREVYVEREENNVA